MSPRLTNVSSRVAYAALQRLGFEQVHVSGSHAQMARERPGGGRDVLTLVLGQREINPFTLRGILRQGNVSEQEFLDASR